MRHVLPAVDRPSTVPPGVLIRLAIIDDHEMVREALVALLSSPEQLFAEVVYRGDSPHEGAAAAPDVALLDIDLGAGGISVTDAVACLMSAGAAVLLISAFEDPVAVRTAMFAGALGFVPKRASPASLRLAIETVAGGEFYLSADLAAILATATESPGLSPRELTALRLYASGLKLSAVAHRMGISPHTAKEYLDRARAKYAQVGRNARTRTELYAQAVRDGLLDQEP